MTSQQKKGNVLLAYEDILFVRQVKKRIEKKGYTINEVPIKTLAQNGNQHREYDLALLEISVMTDESITSMQKAISSLKKIQPEKPIYGLGFFSSGSRDMSLARENFPGLGRIIPYGVEIDSRKLAELIDERIQKDKKKN